MASGADDPRPRRRLAVLACMDARIDLYALLDIGRGDAHIIRNAGGLVSEDALRSLSASQRLLDTEEIVVLMHRGCGLHGASDQRFAESLRADGARPAWRLGAFSDLELTLRAGLERLRSSPELIHHDRIRGLIYDPLAETLDDVEASAPGPGPLSGADSSGG